MNHEHEFNGQRDLSHEKKMHLLTCDDCAEHKEIFDQLHNESKALAEEIPPNFVFSRIERTLTDQKKNERFTWRQGIGLVASVALVAMSVLTFNDYRLQNTFDHLLIQNKLLEEKLIPYQQVSLMGQPLFKQLQVIESHLWQESSMDKKIELLEQRRLCIEEIIQLQQGEKNEFYI